MSGDPSRFVACHTDGSVPREADGRLHSPSFARNYDPIREVLARVLAGRSGTVLEIGSGPGQHIAHLARDLPWLGWQPSDPDPAHLASIAAWRAHLGSPALREPLRLDATADWAAAPGLAAFAPVAAVYVQNVLHIAPWEVAEGIVSGAAHVLAPGGVLLIYGPFREGGAHVSDSNAAFDAALRARDPAWGVRDAEAVGDLARDAGLGGIESIPMPSNNRILRVAFGQAAES